VDRARARPFEAQWAPRGRFKGYGTLAVAAAEDEGGAAAQAKLLVGDGVPNPQQGMIQTGAPVGKPTWCEPRTRWVRGGAVGPVVHACARRGPRPAPPPGPAGSAGAAWSSRARLGRRRAGGWPVAGARLGKIVTLQALCIVRYNCGRTQELYAAFRGLGLVGPAPPELAPALFQPLCADLTATCRRVRKSKRKKGKARRARPGG
jgi:hypothetical protein